MTAWCRSPAASLRFYGPGRTRVLPYCHVSGGGLISDVGLCPAKRKGDRRHRFRDRMTRRRSSFPSSNGTSAWQSVGTAAESDPFLSVDGGLIVAARRGRRFAAEYRFGDCQLAQAWHFVRSSGLHRYDYRRRASTLNITSGSLNINSSVTLPAGGTEPYLVKPGPLIARVFPAAAANFPLELAPRMLISIYGIEPGFRDRVDRADRR